MENNNIYPIFDRMMTRGDKEALLGQRSLMVWFTGLSGSGKSTIAIALERELHQRGLLCRILDGDNIRSGINNNLGFSEADRVENIRRIAEVSKLFVDTGPKCPNSLLIQALSPLPPSSAPATTSARWRPISSAGAILWKYMSALPSRNANVAT